MNDCDGEEKVTKVTGQSEAGKKPCRGRKRTDNDEGEGEEEEEAGVRHSGPGAGMQEV